MPRPPSRLAICMHEAGHAIVQLADAPSPWIDAITVERSADGTHGRVETESLWQPYMTVRASADIERQWAELARRDIVLYLAGPIAELRWRREPRAAIWFTAAQMAKLCLGEDAPTDDSDLGRVRRRLTCAVPGDHRANFIDAWIEAEQCVAEWWPQIKMLGRELNARGRLDDGEVHDLWSAMKTARRSHRAAEKRSAS